MTINKEGDTEQYEAAWLSSGGIDTMPIKDVVKMIDSMIDQGHALMARRELNRPGMESLPFDDTQLGFEFAEKFLKQKLKDLVLGRGRPTNGT